MGNEFLFVIGVSSPSSSVIPSGASYFDSFDSSSKLKSFEDFRYFYFLAFYGELPLLLKFMLMFFSPRSELSAMDAFSDTSVADYGSGNSN